MVGSSKLIDPLKIKIHTFSFRMRECTANWWEWLDNDNIDNNNRIIKAKFINKYANIYDQNFKTLGNKPILRNML